MEAKQTLLKKFNDFMNDSYPESIHLNASKYANDFINFQNQFHKIWNCTKEDNNLYCYPFNFNERVTYKYGGGGAWQPMTPYTYIHKRYTSYRDVSYTGDGEGAMSYYFIITCHYDNIVTILNDYTDNIIALNIIDYFPKICFMTLHFHETHDFTYDSEDRHSDELKEETLTITVLTGDTLTNKRHQDHFGTIRCATNEININDINDIQLNVNNNNNNNNFSEIATNAVDDRLIHVQQPGQTEEDNSEQEEDIQQFIKNMELLLIHLCNTLQENREKTSLFNVLSIESSILYIINFVEINYNNKCQPLIQQLNCIKLHLITNKYDLNTIEDDLSEIMENQTLLLDYKALTQCLKLLIKLIPKEIDNEKTRNKLCNQILYDLLTLVNENDISKKYQQQRDNFYQFLVDILCKTDEIIDPKYMTVTSHMKYEILIKLFNLFSNTKTENPKQLEEIVAKMQNKNDNFAGVITKIMNEQKQEYEINIDKIEFVDSLIFYSTHKIQTPLINSNHSEIYQNCINTITQQSFFNFIQKATVNEEKYPILYKLSQQSYPFWCIQNLPDILRWMSLVHSKYSCKLSESSCDALYIKDVMSAAKFNKWGDFADWKQKCELFKTRWNHLNRFGVTNEVIHDNMTLNSIYSSAISCHGNCRLQKNWNSIYKLIEANNEFLNEKPMIHIDLFDIKSHHLVDSGMSLSNIITQNAKIWVCYDTYHDKKSKTYVIFNLNRIEQEIYSKCIMGRNRLNVKFSNFEFIGGNNILKSIQK
eukprot:320565_1